MRKINNKKKAAAVLGAGVMALTSGGVALAYWTSTGSGSGTAATGNTTSSITVVQTSTSAGLYPGGNVPLSGTFNNSSSGNIRVGTVSATVGTLPSGCVAADFTISGTAPVNAEVPAGNGVGVWSGITLTMNDTGVSQDACKAQTIPVTYSVS